MSALQDEFKAIAIDVSIVRYTSIATLALLVYEYFVTVDEEIRLVWPSRWSFIKFVFLLNRYLSFVSAIIGTYTFIFDPSGNTCKAALFASAILGLSLFIIGEIVLFMRVYAIWFCKRSMLIFLLAVYIPGIVGSTYNTIKTTISASALSIPGVFSDGCLVMFRSREYWINLVVLLFHETLMLTLILIKSLYFTRFSTSTLLRMMVKDGLFYYMCIFSLSVANLLVLLLATANINTFLLITQACLHSILCTRLLLRLRGAYHSLTASGLHSIRLRTLTSTTYVADESLSIPLQDFSTSSRGKKSTTATAQSDSDPITPNRTFEV